MNNDSLKINRHIKAPIHQVYEAWTTPEIMCKWMGPGNVVCEKIIMDVNIGGRYELHMKTDDGMKIAIGEYRVIEENKCLEFTWEWDDSDFKDSIVKISFEDKNGETLLTLNHDHLPSAESASHHNQGWSSSIDKLEHYLSL